MEEEVKILISFCNPLNREKNNLLVLNLENGEKRYILENSKYGVTGVSQDDKYLYALFQDLNSGILIFDKNNFSLILEQKLKNLIDPHSIIVDKDFLYIISTGNDQVLKYKFNKNYNKIDFVESVWKPDDSLGLSDTHHINSIFKDNDSIFISAFGLKNGKWSSAKNGYILNLNKNKKEIFPIYHPHSIFINKNNFYYCESSTRSIKKNNKKIIKLKTGYTRGLFMVDNFLILGTSSGRKKSKSTGEINNPADEGVWENDCRILVYKKNFFGKFKLKKEFNFIPEHQEIYDLMIIK